MLEFKVLGPLRVLVDGEEVPVEEPLDRALLTALLLSPNQVVSAITAINTYLVQPGSLPWERIVESGERLRGLINALPGTTRLAQSDVPGQYVLEVDEDLIDHTRARALYDESQRQPPARRGDLLREALELWPPTAGAADVVRTAPELGVLQLRLMAASLRSAEPLREDTITRTTDLESLQDLVGRGTVSRITRGEPMSKKAREAVLRAAEQLEYDKSKLPILNQPGAEPPGGGVLTAADTMAVSLYLSDEGTHTAVEAAVERVLATAGLGVVERDDPILGSWFRRLRASELGAVAAHAADSRLVLAQDAQVASTLLANLGPVVTSLQPLKEAVIRMGAVLIVKVDDSLAVHQLTAAQQLQLDHQPQLAMAPRAILDALQLRTPERATQDVPQRPLREIT